MPTSNLDPGGSPVVDDTLNTPDITLIEIGGTVGDLEGATYYEAVRQLALRVGTENFCVGFVSYIPYISSVGEVKTKPTQHGVRELRT